MEILKDSLILLILLSIQLKKWQIVTVFTQIQKQ